MKPQLSIEAFRDWCEKQPPDRRYEYRSGVTCACGQFASFLGMEECAWMAGNWYEGPFWPKANDRARLEPHTFGALAARLRRICAS